MKKLTLALTGLLLATALGSPLAQAQTSPPPLGTKQRAPGVPLAPQPGDVARPRSDAGDSQRVDSRLSRNERPTVQADRDLPMPRGVPSIIAP